MSRAIAAYNLTRLVIDDGERQAVGYQNLSVLGDVSMLALNVPVSYFVPGVSFFEGELLDDAVLSLTYDPATGAFTPGLYAPDESGAFAQCGRPLANRT